MSLFHRGFNEKGRTENVLRNVNVSIACQIINTLLGFISRSVFISVLGETYLGVSGVFSNILTILNFAELGLGTAIIYNLYQPLKEHNEIRVAELVNFYQRAYFVIGAVIVVVGVSLTPFLTYLIKKQPDVSENISLLYLLYLSATVVTYYNAHKKSLLHADQRQHVCNIYHQAVHIVQVVAQMVFLVLTRNFILYLVLQICGNIVENMLVARETDKLYPFLREHKKDRIDRNLYRSIKADVSALAVYKLNSAVIHGTDNILITALAEDGVQSVGFYSNYVLISETINTILGIVTNALTPSIGNLNTEKNPEKKESVFYTTQYVCIWAYGWACAGIMALSGRFIAAWLGEKYILSAAVVFAIALQLFIRSAHYPAYTYRVTCGLFVQSKYVPVMTSLINIGLSIWLGKIWGLFGILFATSVARILTVGISDPVLVYKHVFKKNPLEYYTQYCKYSILVILGYFAGKFATDIIPLGGWIGFIVAGVIFSVIFNAIFICASFKTPQFKTVMAMAKRILRKIAVKLHLAGDGSL